MSYILDALRKSDQQRRRGAVPTLHAAPPTVVITKQGIPPAYTLMAVVLLAAGMAIGWLRPWQVSEPSAESALIATKPPVPFPAQTPALQATPLPAPSVKMEADMPLREPGQPVQALPSARATSAKIEEKAKVGHLALAKAVIAPPKDSPKVSPEKPAIAAFANEAPERGVGTLAELPASIRQEIPRMAISGHVYSAEAEGRLVGINDQLVREGESPAPGLVLEQITPDGMVFSYKKYRFRRDAQ